MIYEKAFSKEVLELRCAVRDRARGSNGPVRGWLPGTEPLPVHTAQHAARLGQLKVKWKLVCFY